MLTGIRTHLTSSDLMSLWGQFKSYCEYVGISVPSHPDQSPVEPREEWERRWEAFLAGANSKAQLEQGKP